jgi:hypothetical protein
VDSRAGAHDTIDENSMVGVAAVNPSQAHGQRESLARAQRPVINDAPAHRLNGSRIVTSEFLPTTLGFGCPNGTEDTRTRASVGHVSRSARIDA